MTEQEINETQEFNTPESFLPEKVIETPPTESILANLQKTAVFHKNKLNQIIESKAEGESEISKVLRANEQGLQAFEYSDSTREDMLATLNDGSKVAKYDTFVHGEDNNELYANAQTTGEKWKNGLTKLGGKFLTGVAGNVGASIYGLGEAIGTSNFDAIFDNSMTDYLDDLNTTMDNKLPNFYSKAESNMSLMESTGTANFWANDVTGGAVFTLSAIASEAMLMAASGGLSLATTGARVGNYTARAFKGGAKLRATAKELATLNTSSYYNKLASIERGATSIGAGIGKTASAARFMYTTSMYESGFETREFRKDMRNNFEADFYSMNDRLPDIEERKDFEANLNDASGVVFAANMAIVGTSNLFGQVANIVGYRGSRVTTSAFGKSLYGSGINVNKQGVHTAIKATSAQKKARVVSSLLKGSLPEAAEEGGQSVTSIGATKWVTNKFNPDYEDTVYDLMDGFQDGVYDTFTTTQGQKEMFIGALLGLVSGSAGSIRRHGSLEGKYAQQDLQNESFAKFMNSFSGKNFSETLMYGQRTSEASKAFDEAIEKKDPIASERARMYSTVSQLNYAYNMEYYDKTVGDSIISMQSIPLKEIMDTYSMTETEAAEFKNQQIASYRNIASEYKKNRAFAEDFFGEKLTEKENEVYKGNIESLKEIVAYNLTVGKEAYEESGRYFDQLTEAMSTIFPEVGTSMKETIMALASLNKDDANLMESIPAEIAARTEELENLRELIRITPVTTTQESKELAVNELNRITILIAENERVIEKLEQQANLLMSAAAASRFYTDESVSYVTADDLLSMRTFLDNLEKIEGGDVVIGGTNSGKIKSLIGLYSSSLQDFKYYSQMVDDMNVWTFEVTGNKNKLDKLREEFPSLEFATQRFLENTEKRRQEDVTNIELSEANLMNSLRLVDIINKTPGLKVKESVIEEEPTDPTDIIRKKIKTLISKSPYLKSKEVEIEGDPALVYGVEDVAEDMRQLMSDGTVDSETKKTLQEYLDILESIEESETTPMDNGIQEEGFDQILSTQDKIYYDPKGAKLEVRDSSAVQVYENAFIKMGKEAATVYNITPSGFMSAIGYEGRVEVTDANGNTVITTVSGAAQYRGEGTTYTLSIGDKVVVIEDVANGNMSINKEDIVTIKSLGGIDFYNSALTRTNEYVALYSQGKPLKSDFENNNEGLTYTPQQAYNLKPNDEIGFVVNKEDSYNKQILDEYFKSDMKQKDRDNLKNNIKIDIVDSKGNVIGTLKGTQNTSNLDPNFIALRSQAVKDALSTSNTGLINVDASTTIDHVFLGIPNFVIQDGEIVMQEIDPADVVDFGYYEKGRLKLRGDTQEVRVDIVNKVKNPSSPVVVVRHQGVLIAFPVSIKKNAEAFTPADFLEELNSSENRTRYIIDLNHRMRKAGMNPATIKAFYLTAEEQNLFNEDLVLENDSPFREALIELSERESSYDYKKEWFEEGFTKQDLPAQSNIGIDTKSDFMTSPKPIISLENIKLTRPSYVVDVAETISKAGVVVKEIAAVKKTIASLSKEKTQLGNTSKLEKSVFTLDRNGKKYVVTPEDNGKNSLLTEVSSTKGTILIENTKSVVKEFSEKSTAAVEAKIQKEKDKLKTKIRDLVKLKMSIEQVEGTLINNENIRRANEIIEKDC